MKLEKVLTENQTERLLKLISQIWPDYYIPIIGSGQVEYMMTTYQSKKEIINQIYSGTDYFILIVDNFDGGYMAYEKREEGLYLSKLYLLKSLRGRGLGRFMEETAVKAAKEAGLNYIYLNVNKKNMDSINIYQKLGYKIQRETIKEIGQGYVMDDYIMGKFI